MHAFDRQTDRILIARPRLYSMQRAKTIGYSMLYTYAYLGCVVIMSIWPTEWAKN